MRIEIEIPKEFEYDYKSDKFKDFFSRVLCDIEEGKCLCGTYEIETIEMLEKAFDESKQAYDAEKAERQIKDYFCKVIDACEEDIVPHEILKHNKAICEIVKKGGVE